MNYITQAFEYPLYRLADAIVTSKKQLQPFLPTNLEEATSLIFAKNSQKVYSRDITESVNTDLTDVIQQKITKLVNNNKDFICKQPVFSLLCNNIITQSPRIIIYKSSENTLNLNCKVNALTHELTYSDKTIVCRHISYGYATDQFKLHEIDSKEKLQAHPFFQKDYVKYFFHYFPAEGYYFQSKDIAKALRDIAKNLLVNNIKYYKSYMLYTLSHAMALRIKFNGNYFKIKVYDPNYTIRETIIIIKSIEDITLLEITDIINKVALDYYSEDGKCNALCLLSTDLKKTQFNCKINVYGAHKKFKILMEKSGHDHIIRTDNTDLQDNLISALINNRSNDVYIILKSLLTTNIIEAKAYIKSVTVDYIPAFELCLVKGNVASIKVYLSCVINSEIHFSVKSYLVGGLVHLPIKFNQVAATVVYTNAIIFAEQLSPVEKFKLLDSKLLLELPYLDNPNENKALPAFINIIQRSSLSILQKEKLLPTKLVDKNTLLNTK